MGDAHGWLNSTLVYLAAAVVAVPLARLLGLGSIIGYLAAGIAIGPWGLQLVTDPKAMLGFAEFGVVLMLFLVGLELEPRRLWSLRRPIFGWGSVQLFGSALLIGGVALASGVDWRLALVAGAGLAMSSTAIGLGVLGERNLMATGAGQSVLSVALLQDIAAIPILATVPLLMVAGTGAAANAGDGWLGAAKALGVIAAIIFGGRLLLRPALRWIARSDTPEIFTAAALLLVVATAARLAVVSLQVAARDMLVLTDADAARGMGHTIAAGVAERSGATGWLVLPGDMPLVVPHSIRAVADALEHNPVVYAQHRGRQGHPVGFSAELYSELVRLTGDDGARRVMARYPAHGVELDDPGVLLDVDTAANLHALRARLERPGALTAN